MWSWERLFPIPIWENSVSELGWAGYPQALENLGNGPQKFHTWKNDWIWNIGKYRGQIKEFEKKRGKIGEFLRCQKTWKLGKNCAPFWYCSYMRTLNYLYFFLGGVILPVHVHIFDRETHTFVIIIWFEATGGFLWRYHFDFDLSQWRSSLVQI